MTDKCKQELLKMFQRLIDKKSKLIDKSEIINGELYARCSYLGNAIMMNEQLEKKIKTKIRTVTGKKAKLHMHLDKAKKMTLIKVK